LGIPSARAAFVKLRSRATRANTTISLRSAIVRLFALADRLYEWATLSKAASAASDEGS